MANTFELIASYTASGSVASIDFTSIPSTYTDLVLIVNGALPASSGLYAIGLEFNGDTTTSNYSYTRLQGNGTSATSNRASSDTAIGFIAETASMDVIQIMNYSNTSTYKTTLSRASSSYASDGRTAAYVSLWRNTAAINRIDIKSSVNYTSATTFTLYGILSA